MGREIRRVPPNWEHPKTCRLHGYDYQPMCDRSYADEAKEWIEACISWANGTHADQGEEDRAKYPYYWDYAGMPPDREYYVPYDPDDKPLCTWWQCYETVSEGCPVSPPFATAEALIDYLATNGDFWEQRRARDEGRAVRPSSREAVTRFVLGTGWAPSMVVRHSAEGVSIASGIDALEVLRDEGTD